MIRKLKQIARMGVLYATIGLFTGTIKATKALRWMDSKLREGGK